jgi:hypothetical protein
VRAGNKNSNESVGDGGPEEGPKNVYGNEMKTHYWRVKRGKNFRVNRNKGIGLYVV